MKDFKIWILSVKAGFYTNEKIEINYAICKNQVSTQSGKATVTDLPENHIQSFIFLVKALLK